MSLAILTEEGQKAADDQILAVDIILSNPAYLGTQFIFTAMDDSAAVDGIFVRENEIKAVAEIKTRYGLTEEEFFTKFKGEWLLTFEKMMRIRLASDLLRVPGFGILFLKDSGVVLMKELSTKHGLLHDGYRKKLTETQATINGGTAVRENAFIEMREAKRYVMHATNGVSIAIARRAAG